MDCEARAELRGHAGRVVALLAHPSRPLLVSGGGGEGLVRVWDLETRALLRTLAGHRHVVWGLAFCPDGTRLATGSRDATVNLWDFDSGERLHTLCNDSMRAVHAVAWDAAGACLASGSNDGGVRVYNAASGALRHKLAGHRAPVGALAVRPGDDLLASGSADRTVRLWRFSTGALVRTLAGHEREVMALAASAHWLLSGSTDRSVRVWSWDGICARVLKTARQLYWNSLAWRDSTFLTLEYMEYRYDDTRVHVWDASAANPSAWSCVGTLGKASSHYGVAAAGGRAMYAAPGDAIALHALRTPRERRGIRRPAARV